MKTGLSNTAFGKLIGIGEAAVRKGEKAGKIRRFADGSIDAEASRALWQAMSDPARTKVRARTSASASASARCERQADSALAAESGPPPTPADYRGRSDLPDDFARGAIYAAHVLAHGLPAEAARVARDAGASADVIDTVYNLLKVGAALSVGDVCRALGLVDVDAPLGGPFEPVEFEGPPSTAPDDGGAA